jgi:hypothetical protein
VGLIYPNVNNATVYRDPGDHSRWPLGASYGKPRVRSMSMNCWLNPIPGRDWNSIKGYSGDDAMRIYAKQSDFRHPTEIFVFIDENPGTINDGYFVCDPNQSTLWEDTPAAYHGNGGCLSYADGHAEIKTWHDGGVLAAQNRQSPGGVHTATGATDLIWLQQRSTERMSP